MVAPIMARTNPEWVSGRSALRRTLPLPSAPRKHSSEAVNQFDACRASRLPPDIYTPAFGDHFRFSFEVLDFFRLP